MQCSAFPTPKLYKKLKVIESLSEAEPGQFCTTFRTHLTKFSRHQRHHDSVHELLFIESWNFEIIMEFCLAKELCSILEIRKAGFRIWHLTRGEARYDTRLFFGRRILSHRKDADTTNLDRAHQASMSPGTWLLAMHPARRPLFFLSCWPPRYFVDENYGIFPFVSIVLAWCRNWNE